MSNNEQQQRQQQDLIGVWSCFTQISAMYMFSLPLNVTIVQDNAALLPNCISKTMRSYLLRKFPDLATVSEEARWLSQPHVSKDALDEVVMKKILPMAAPQRQDSFSISNSSHSTSSLSSTSSANCSFAPAPINRRQFLARQESSFSMSHRSMSRLIRQTSLRGMMTGQPGEGLPRMPQRQDSVSFLF